MAIRKGRLNRICTKCGDNFEPNGKWSKLCNKCNPQKNKGWLNELIINQNTTDL